MLIDWFLRRLAQPGEGEKSIHRKRTIFYLMLASTVLSSLGLFAFGFKSLGVVPALIGVSTTFAQMMVERRVRETMLEWLLYSIAVSIFISDLRSAVSHNDRVWSMNIVLVDIALVCRLPNRATLTIIGSSIVWFMVVAMEYIYRFGLFDIPEPFLIGYQERRELCGCTEPPCEKAVSAAVSVHCSHAAVFLLDFYFTRNFSTNLHKQNDAMERVIKTAEWTALCLSRFDLEEAEEAVSASQLPPPLYASFRSILSNLRTYRPYLPQSCFISEQLTSETSSSRAKKTESSETNSTMISSSKTMEPEVLSAMDKRSITYMVANITGTHEDVEKPDFSERYAVYITVMLQSVRTNTGVVGVLVGDHVHASFNAASRCLRHSVKAVTAAIAIESSLESSIVIIGLATGTAYCGATGCPELMSHTMLGSTAVTSSLLERFWRWEWPPDTTEHRIACNLQVFKDTAFIYSFRLVLARLEVRGRDAPIRCYVLANEVEAKQESVEWLYSIEDSEWSDYNDAGESFLKGDNKKALSQLSRDNHPSGHVIGAAIEKLKSAVINGAPCRVVVL